MPAGARSYKDLNRADKGFGLVWEEGESHGIQSQGQDHSVISILSRDRKLTSHQGTQLSGRVSYALVAAVSFGFALGVLYLLSTHKGMPEKNMKTRMPFTQLYQVLTSSCF